MATFREADDEADTEPADVARARNREHRLAVALDRMLDAVRAGMDPTLVAGRTRKIQTDIMTARSIIERWARSHDRPTQLGEADLRAVLTATSGLVKLLGEAERIEQAAPCSPLGLSLKYEKEAPTGRELVRAQLEPNGGGGSIGSRAARTSASAKVLVVAPCIRSRPGAALLSVGAPRCESP